MELENNLLANILFAFLAIGYVVLTAGLMFWLLVVGRKSRREYLALDVSISLPLCARGRSARFRRGC